MPFEDLLQPQQIDPNTGLNTSQGGFESLFSTSDFRAPQTTGAHLTSKYDEDLKIFEDVNAQRAAKQSSAEQFGAFLNQAVVGEIIGGTIEGLGYLGDLDDATKIIDGEGLELGNAVVDFGQSLRAWSKEVTPIYETAPGKFAPGNFSWWAANGTSVASTLALMVPAAGTVKGLSMLGKAAGITANLSKTAGIAATGISQAVVSRHIENLLEASGKYDEIYERNLSRGLSEEEAKQNAGVAASDIYQKNWVMLAQDIPQYLLLGKSFGKASKALTPGVAEATGQAAGLLKAKVAGRYFLDALSEGGEEAYQYVVSEKADDLAMSKIDPDYRPRELQEFLKEDEFWTSTTMGMLGAGVFQAGGRAINKMLGNTEDKQRIQNIRDHGPTIKYYSEMIKDAEARNDYEAYEEARQGMVNTLAGKASEYGNLDILVNNLEQIMEQEATPEITEKYGLEVEDIDNIKKNFPSFIKDVKEVGKAYEAYAQGKVDGTKYDPDVASSLAQLETSKRRLGIRKNDLKAESAAKESVLLELGFDELSSTSRAIMNINAALTSHDKLIKYIKSAAKKKDITDQSKDYYTKALKEQGDIVLKLRNDRQELKKNDAYTKEEQLNDKKINLDSSVLTEIQELDTKLKYTELALDKKDDTIKNVKELQKQRNKGEKPIPQEPDLASEPEVVAEEPISETTHEATDTTSEETVVATKLYEADPKEIAKRRKLSKDAKAIQKSSEAYGRKTLNELFSEFESADALFGNPTNTGKLQREGDKIYFYEDNTGIKKDVTQYADIIGLQSKIVILGIPKPYVTDDPVKESVEDKDDNLNDNEIEATLSQEPMVEHPDSDEEQGAKNIKDDTIVATGEVELVYLYNKEKGLAKYLENPDNDISKAIGTFSIDYDNITIQNNKSLLKALKSGNTVALTQEQLDQVPIAITLDNVQGTIFVPRPSNIAENEQANIRATRTTIIKAVLSGNKTTIKGFRKDSGHRYITKTRGEQNNLVKSLNIDPSEIRIGVALRTGIVYGKDEQGDDEVLGIRGNPNGGNVYLYTDRTPNKEFRGVKLNKAKITPEHANIILNAFQQGIKSFKNAYEGTEVEGDINVGALLNILVQNGEETIISTSKQKAIKDKAFLERLYKNQLYSSKGFLHYGKSGKISLRDTTPEDRDNFVQYAQENFNYAIALGRLKEIVPNIKIGTTQLGENTTFEQMYAQNGWVTTDVVADKYGNILQKPQIYVNFSNDNKLEIEKTTEPKGDVDPLQDLFDEFRPFSSTYYEGKQYLHQSPESQIKQIQELIGRDIPIEVTEDFIRVVDETGSHMAFGQVKNVGIQLYEKAEDGTGYHEAFHVVSLYYLTGRERKKVYDDASTYYNINRGDERAIEEALAEDFRKYMLSEKRIAPKQKTTRTFFQKLYDFIIDLFVSPTTRISDLTIDSLFNNIENSKYTTAKIKNKNLKKYAGYNYLRKIEGFSTEQVYNITNLLMYQLLTKNNVIKLEDIDKLSMGPVIKFLEDFKDGAKKVSETPGISAVNKQEAERLYEVYSKILEKDNFEQFNSLLDDRLFAMNINRKPDVYEDTTGTDVNNIFVNDSGGTDLTKYMRSSYEVSGKDNLLANIKLFIATLPTSGEIDPYTQMPKMTDYTESYSKIMKDLNTASNFEEIIKILEQKVSTDPYYEVLLNGNLKKGRIGLLNAPTSFKHQFEIAVYMHRHDFVNVVVDADGNHIFVNAAVSKAERDLANEWGLEFYLSNKYINTDDSINSEALNKVLEEYVTNIQGPVNAEYSRGFVIENYNLYIDRVLNILSDIGVNVSKKDLNNVITQLGTNKKGNINKNVGLSVLVNKTLFGFFGAKGVIPTLSSGELRKFDKPEEVLAKDSKIIEFARMIISGNIYLIDDTVLGAENNTYYVYALPNLLTEYTKELKKDSQLFKDLSSVIYNKNSQFLKQIDNGKEFGISTFASYRLDKKEGKDYKKIRDIDDFLLKFNSLYNGLIPLPTLADRKAYYFYKGLDKINLNDSLLKNGKYTISDRVIDIFYDYAKDEEARIAKVTADITAYRNETDKKVKKELKKKLVLYKHYIRNDSKGNPIFNNEAQGLKFRHFTDFNIYDKEGNFIATKDINKASISKAFRDNTIDTIKYAEKLGLLTVNRDPKDNIRSLSPKKGVFGKELLASTIATWGTPTNALYHMMAEYTLNTAMSVIETEKLITGDPSYYKTTEDKIKRLNAPIAPGSKVIEEFTEGEFKDIKEYKSAIIKTFKYNDKKLIAKLAPKFAEVYKKQNPEATKKEIEESVTLRLEPYTKVDVTDAQVYVTPDMYRSLKIRMGEWEEDTHEKAYQALINGIPNPTDKLAAEKLIMQPLKLVHFGQYFKVGEGIPVYDKMSVSVLLPSVVEGTLLEPLYTKMVTDGIDMVKYDSAVKVGNTGAIDYFDREGNPMVDNLVNLSTFNQRFKYLRKQQVTDPHVTETRMLGTQVKKVVMQNLKLDSPIYKIKGSNKKYTGRDIADMFSKAYATLSNRGRADVEKNLGIDENGNINKEKLYTSLQNAAEQSNQPYNVIDSLFVDENGNPNVQLDTLLNRSWTESRMISFITKNTIDAVLPGTDLIQMSGGGLVTSNSDQLDLLDDKGRTEIRVSISLFKSLIPDYSNKTHEEKIKWLKKNWNAGFDGIGYRIPTQGQNSVVPFVIKDFLPDTYGNTIILPYGFTALTGSDFDIDKLFIAKYNYYTLGDTVKKYKFYEGNEEGIIEDEDTLKEVWKYYVLPKIIERDNLVELKERIDEKIALKATAQVVDSIIQDTWEEFLPMETKINIAESLGIDTITQDVLALVGKQMTYDELVQYIKEAAKYPDEAQFIKDNTGKDAFEINHKKAVQNRLLDLMFSVLTNEEHILETKTPLDTFTEKLKSMAAVVKSKAPLTMLQSISPSYQLQVKNWYVGGGKGIGPFALNNVHHALTQVTGYNVDSYDIGGTLGKDGVAIVDWLSALINANVDIAKDPYIFHLNVHQGTYNMVNFLIRAGYGEQTFWLINQLVIKEKFDAEEKAIRVAGQNATAQQLGLRKKEIYDIIEEYSSPAIVLADELLESYITEDNKDYKYYAKQAGIAKAYELLEKPAGKLSNGVLLSRIDNKGFGNTMAELRKFDKDFQLMMEIDDSFANLINNTFLKTLYNNSIPFIRNLYSGLTLDSTNGFDEIVDAFSFDYSELDRKTVGNAVYSAIISKYFTDPQGFNLTKEKVKDLFKGENSLGYRVRNLEKSYPELLSNKFIQTLKPVFDREDSIWFNKYISGDKNDKFIRDSYTEAWADLLEHSDLNVRKLGEDLMYYSFYTSGFNRSLYSFYQDLPISKLLERPNHGPKELTKSFDEFIQSTLQTLNSFVLSYEYKTDIIKEAKKYLGGKSIPEYTGLKNAIVVENKVGMFKFNSNDLNKIGDNINGDPIFQNLYTVKDSTYGTFTVEYVGYKTDSKEAIYRVIPSSGLDYRGHKIYELGYEGSIFEDTTADISDEVLATKLATYDGFSDFIYISPENKDIIETKEPVVKKNKQQVIEFDTPTTVSFYTNDIKPSPNTIFVFGSNPEGRHGAGAAKVAKNKFGAIYGQGEGLQGNSYALPTKDLRIKENKGFKSISSENIIQSIQKLYEVAKQNPNKQFAIGYRNTTERSLNGYTGLEMIDMFTEAGVIPNNILFSKEWFDTGKIQKDIKTEEIKPELTNLQEARLAQLPENIRNHPDVINAAINMNKKEFKSIVEQIKKCN